MAGKYTLEGKNGIIALKMLEDVSRVLKKNDVEFWLESGTLLGIVREKRLLPWDNDVDIAIKEESKDKLLFSLKEIASLGYRVRVRKFKINSDPFKLNLPRTIKIKNRKFFFFKGEVNLDIYIKYKKDKKYYYQCGTTKKATNAAYYDTLDEIEFNSNIYKIPNNHEAYLTSKYGEWRVTDKNWSPFIDDNAIVSNM